MRNLKTKSVTDLIPNTAVFPDKLLYPSNQKPMEFQVEAIWKMLDFLVHGEERACYNACEQGLGKSIQAMVAANSLKASRILIICPSVAQYTWLKFIDDWSVKKRNVLVASSSKYLREARNKDVVITTFGLAARGNNAGFIASMPWELLIIDEAHYLKSYDAQRTRAVLDVIWPKCRYRIALSGTPFTNNVVDGYTLFSKMAPNDFPTFFDFAAEYSHERDTPWGTERWGVKNVEKLRNIIRSKFYIRYTKAEHLPGLPEKTYAPIQLGNEYHVETPNTDREKLDAAVRMILMSIDENREIPPVPVTLAGQRRAQGLKKLPAVIEFCDELLKQGIPLVVFAWHREFISKFSEHFKNYKPSVITGDTQPAKRALEVQRFQNGETDLFVGNMVAAGVNVTLTRASNVVLGELDWSPHNIAQAVDRCHRIGQESHVTAYYFVVKDSIDEKIADAVMRKAKDFASVLEN